MSASNANPPHTNRLIHESSPYLLQHAHNPVDWYAWGPEAFEAARARNKPIFLSVGYSTCYWCHVMERQCFEVDAIAAVMNELFINIKVDREERPDVDQLYMTAVQVLTHQGGWPMSVFLTPDLKPFYGGTYFPPEDGHGRPGFVTVLRAIDDHYRNNRAEIEKAADQLVGILHQVAEPAAAEKPMTLDSAFIDRMIARSTSDYESGHGGFGNAPKFPRETLLELLLTYSGNSQTKNPDIMAMTRHALDAMADGGIRDHLGGGFHRYSTDTQWLVPHFEIMLYDNAMLGWCYAEAFRQTGEIRYANVARGVFDFVLREMTSPSGAFYTAFDAEVDAREGLSYLWTEEELAEILGPDDAKMFGDIYGVDRGPNFADPHHGDGRPDKNILFLPNGPGPENEPRIIEMRRQLYDARRQRKQPSLDTKVLTSWNALMIRAMAFASKLLNEPKYLRAAESATDFLLTKHRTSDGGLFRTSRLDATPPSPAKLAAFLDDYAFLAQALLALHAAGGESRRRDAAEQIAGEMNARFLDSSLGGYYFTDESATDLIVRQKTASDSPLPSGNAVAAMVMMELGQTEIAGRAIQTFLQQIQAHGEGMSAMVQAAMNFIEANGPITIEPAERSTAIRATPLEVAQGIVTLQTHWIDPKHLAVVASIKSGFHINTNRPGKDLVATELRVAGDAKVGSIDYPSGREERFGFSDAPISVYSGQIELHVHFVAPVSAGLDITLQYQACDEQACLPPASKRLSVTPM